MKLAFWGLFVAGFAACAMFGIGPTLKRVAGNWTSPSMLAGIVLGVAIVAVAVALATGFRPSVLATDTSMVVALAVLMAAKVGVSLAQVAVTAMSKG